MPAAMGTSETIPGRSKRIERFKEVSMSNHAVTNRQPISRNARRCTNLNIAAHSTAGPEPMPRPDPFPNPDRSPQPEPTPRPQPLPKPEPIPNPDPFPQPEPFPNP